MTNLIGPITVDFQISLTRRGDLAAQVYRQLLDAILDGRLRAGEKLPPSRELAKRLEISRNTVAAAYDRLTAEGFLIGRVGAGTFVGTFERKRRRGAPSGSVRPREVWQSMAVPPPNADTPEYDFRVGIPDPHLFPMQTWRRLVTHELRPSSLAGYADPAGHVGLRDAISRYAGRARSVKAEAADVIVTQGAQQALDLIGRVLIEPGSVVALEEPGYPPARLLFQSLGARIAPVPVDAEGLDVRAIPKGTRLIYTTPSHQFPLGMPMSLHRRTALLDWAQRHDAAIIEDDYDSEYRFADRPLASLQSLDPGGRVIYVGSFSKTLLPTLRLGYLVAPATLQPALRAAKQLADWHSDLTSQAALARFIDEGLLERHIRKTIRGYQSRRQEILTILTRDFGKWLTVVPSVAGLHISAHLHPFTAVDLDRARGLGVAVRPLEAFYARLARPGLVIGYGAVRADRIADGLRLLASTFRTESP